jgi:hypothetical protein
MLRWPIVRAVALPLLIAACGHRGHRMAGTGDPAVDPAAAAMVAGGGTFCVVRPPVRAAAPPRYALAAAPDSALLHAQSGQLVLQVERIDDDDDRGVPQPHAIVLLQQQPTVPPPAAVTGASPEELGRPVGRAPPRAVPVAAGQTDTTGQLILRPVVAGRYLGEVYAAARLQPWTGAVDVRMGYADTVRIAVRPKSSRTPVTLAPCE